MDVDLSCVHRSWPYLGFLGGHQKRTFSTQTPTYSPMKLNKLKYPEFMEIRVFEGGAKLAESVQKAYSEQG